MADYQQFNSFYIVNSDVYTQFYELIKQDHILYDHLMKKAHRNPFYLDFLCDTWILFYYKPNRLITNPLRTLYLLIRKTILDIAAHDKAIRPYYEQTVNNEHASLYYALLLCESTSLYFKQAMQYDSFKEHLQHVAHYYYQNIREFEPNIVANGIEEPLYVQSQVFISKDMLYSTKNDCSIGQLFSHYAAQQLSIFDVLKLNKDSCMDYIKRNQTVL